MWITFEVFPFAEVLSDPKSYVVGSWKLKDYSFGYEEKSINLAAFSPLNTISLNLEVKIHRILSIIFEIGDGFSVSMLRNILGTPTFYE